jgi:hypothetical protein
VHDSDNQPYSTDTVDFHENLSACSLKWNVRTPEIPASENIRLLKYLIYIRVTETQIIGETDPCTNGMCIRL